jgi:hypothetical protein
MKCPTCGKRIVQIGLDGKVKIRTNIVCFQKSGYGAVIVCRHCKNDVMVDLNIGESLQKALTPRLVIKARKKK